MTGEVILALCIAILILAVVIIAYRSWEDRRKSNDFYQDSVIAYKVGLIEKKAKDNNIKLVYPEQKDEFIDRLDKELAGDLNRID